MIHTVMGAVRAPKQLQSLLRTGLYQGNNNKEPPISSKDIENNKKQIKQLQVLKLKYSSSRTLFSEYSQCYGLPHVLQKRYAEVRTLSSSGCDFI